MAGRILLIAADVSVREFVDLALRDAGLPLSTLAGGRDALPLALRGDVALVIVDLALGGDAIDACRRIRRRRPLPVLLLASGGDLVDVVAGLEAGADDYLHWPPPVDELLVRIRALLRLPVPPGDGHRFRAGDLEIDGPARVARREGRPLPLTGTEFRLLYELARRPGRVLTRRMLLELVWHYDFLGESRLVDVAVQRLRSKVEPNPRQPTLIRTVRGVGYRWSPG